MINNGYTISVQDTASLKSFKSSSAYGMYLKSIAKSPAFKSILKEHVENINVEEDIKVLKSQGIIPENINNKTLSDLIKSSFSKMAICIAADSIILKEMETIKIQEIVTDLNSDADITYLLGKADKKYYEQANKLLDQGKLEDDSIGYKGLVNYLKKSGKFKDLKKTKLVEEKRETISTPKREMKKIDTDSNDITL